MHIRHLGKRTNPAPAFNVEQILFIANGMVGLANSTLNVGNTAVTLVNGLSNLLKPTG